MKKRKIGSLLLCGMLLAGMLAGCGNQPNGSKASSAAQSSSTSAADSSATGSTESTGTSDEPVTLRITWWGNQLRNDTTTKMLDAFKAENPNVTFEAEFSDWSGYWDKLATQAASDNMPDIVQQDYSYIAQYHARNQLTNLSEQVEKGNLNIDNINDSVLQNGSFDGQLFALCAGINAQCTVYDADVFEAAGVTMPERPTYQDIMDLAAQVYEKTGVKGEVPSGGGPLSMMARDQGQAQYDIENHKIGASEEVVLSYFQLIKDAITSDWSISVDVMQEASTAGLEASPLATQKSCYNFPGGSNMVAALQNATSHKLKIVMYPRSEDYTKESMYLRPSMFWSISQNSQNKDWAARVIDYYTNAKDAQDILLAERGVPVSSEMADYLKPKLDQVQQEIFDYVSKVGDVAVPFDPPPPNGSTEADKLLGDLTDRVRYGELSPEDAAKQYISGANDVLAKAAG